MNVYKLEAAIGLNTTEYKKGLAAAGESMSAMGDKIKAGAAAIGKATAAGLAAGSAAVTALAKSAVSAYADYEQLVGGIETLFGNSAQKVIANSEKAFATAGMSVNEYMETSIQSAASLISSLEGDQEKAAELMDMSIQDMSDNVNKMGTTMEAVQNAYRGFSRQNFTMLDNLALGFAGTKEGMQQLLDKAKEISGIEYNIESYSDIVQAIHVVQTEMGITGTTAKEAAGTISGSISSVKAAWKNLTIEIAKDDGDISGAFEVLGENVGAVVDNMLPRVEKALGGIGQFIAKSAPQITNGLKQLLPRVLPTLLQTAGTLVSSVSSAVMQSLPELMDIGGGLLDSFAGNSQYIFQSAQKLLSNFADQLINVDYGKLAKNISTVFVNAVNSITDFVKGIDFYKVGENIATFLNNIDWQQVANSIFDLIAAGIKALPDIAVSFFANADLGNLMTMIGLLSAPKLLGGITEFTGGAEGKALGEAAGTSWSGAFMAGIKAFGLGWAIGSYLRDNITIGDKTIGEWVDAGTEKLFGDAEEKAEAEWGVGTTVKDEKGREVITHDENGNRTTAFNMLLKKNAEDQAKAWSNFNIEEYRRQNHLMGYADGGRVTHPQLAIVGEKEPETIIPDSKLGSIGNTTNYITINVDGYNIKNDEEFTELLSRKLSELSVRQQRAVGGAGW